MMEADNDQYVKTDIAFVQEFPFGIFSYLSEDGRDMLVAFIAGCAEQSYRRGFQQGHWAATEGETPLHDLWEWRFKHCLAESPSPEKGGWGTFATERLQIECRHWLDHVFGLSPATWIPATEYPDGE